MDVPIGSAVVVGVTLSTERGVSVAVAFGGSVASGWVQAAKSREPVAMPSNHGKRMRTPLVYQ